MSVVGRKQVKFSDPQGCQLTHGCTYYVANPHIHTHTHTHTDVAICYITYTLLVQKHSVCKEFESGTKEEIEYSVKPP